MKIHSKKKEMGTRVLGTKFLVLGPEGKERERALGPARCADLFRYLTRYLSSAEPENKLSALIDDQTQSPEKPIRIQVNHPETSLHSATRGMTGWLRTEPWSYLGGIYSWFHQPSDLGHFS